MATSSNPPWAELVQLIPIVSLALPFIASGKVDLARAGGGLVVGALLTIVVSALVLWRGAVLNPILLGTALWLWVGAAAFVLPLPALWASLVEAQGFGPFAGVLVLGVATLLFSKQGFVGCRSTDARFVLKASLGLLTLTLAALAWSWAHRDNIRLGGGLPFIVLNVVRRVLVLRAPGARAAVELG